MMDKLTAVIIMGVAGSGKTTVGEMLSDDLGWTFYDADDFHPQANIDKMAQGLPLTDEDREPWLDTLHKLIAEHVRKGIPMVLACSALKRTYRQKLLVDDPRTLFVYLQGEYKLILKRMQGRRGHYMKPDMLKSQFEALEEPVDALTISVEQELEEIVKAIVNELDVE